MYLQILRSHILRLRANRFDVVGALLRMGLDTGVLLLFWGAVAASNPGTVDARAILSYFLLAGAVNDLSGTMNLRLAGSLHDLIKSGAISRYMLKPVDLLPHVFADTVGRYITMYGIAVLMLVAGLAVRPPTALGALLFLPFLACAVAVSYSLCVMVGCVAFAMGEAASVKWTIYLAIRFLAGAVIPLAFLPDAWQRALALTPFPSMISGPVLALHATSISPALQTQLLTGAIWAAALYPIAGFLWSRSMRRYEAVGI